MTSKKFCKKTEYLLNAYYMQSCQLKINSIIFDKFITFDIIKIYFNENITAIPKAI